MKKLLYLAVAVATTTLVACGPKTSSNSFTITGTVENGADGDTVLIMLPSRTIDTTVIANGVFTFTGKTDSIVGIAQMYAPKQQVLAYCLLEPGKINAVIAADDKVTGTPLNDALQVIKEKVNAGTEKLKAAQNADEKKAAYQEIIGTLSPAITANLSNSLGKYLLQQYYSEYKSADLLALIATWPEAEQQENFVVRLKKYLVQNQETEKAQEATAEGQKFIDLAMKTPAGKDIKLSDYAGKGKYVLVDFWASWCGPCRNETPKLVELYKACKGKDFEIVGISFDQPGANEAWKQGIKDLNITWPQMSDLKYWQSEGAKVYGVNSIPHLMLIDRDGTIISRGLRAAEMADKVKELLGKK